MPFKRFSSEELRTYKDRLLALESMLTSLGWQLLEAQFGYIEQAAYTKMMDAPDAHHMAKHAGAYFAVKELRSWPTREIAALKDALLDADQPVE